MVAPIRGKGSPAQKPNGINAKILYLLYGPNLDRTNLYIRFIKYTLYKSNLIKSIIKI